LGVSREVVVEFTALGAASPEALPAPVPTIVRPNIAQLNDRITQLQQMRDWLKDDHLRAMMDGVIGQQVAKSERRQIFYTVVVSILSLVAGWLLSAISPILALAQLLPR
jgi:hypothetical protein